jgi:hypothetical protein
MKYDNNPDYLNTSNRLSILLANKRKFYYLHNASDNQVYLSNQPQLGFLVYL